MTDNIKPTVQDKAAWAKVPQEFNDWWNSDYSDESNPFRINSAAYWAWAGWSEAVRLNVQAVPSVEASDMVATERKRCESLARQALDAGMSGNWARAEMLMTDIKWGNYYTHIQLHPIDTLSAAPAAPQPARQPLTDEQCDAIYTALDAWARKADAYEFGLPRAYGGGAKGGREIIRNAISGVKND